MKRNHQQIDQQNLQSQAINKFIFNHQRWLPFSESWWPLMIHPIWYRKTKRSIGCLCIIHDVHQFMILASIIDDSSNSNSRNQIIIQLVNECLTFPLVQKVHCKGWKRFDHHHDENHSDDNQNYFHHDNDHDYHHEN